MRETGRNGYQYKLRQKLKTLFPGCIILKNDPSSNFQGVPDLIVLYNDKWAMLEVKGSEDAEKQPNQEYYVNMFGEMSYAAFIHPGNEEEVLSDLQSTFET